jgi:SAM-dependent methyltransferase
MKFIAHSLLRFLEWFLTPFIKIISKRIIIDLQNDGKLDQIGTYAVASAMQTRYLLYPKEHYQRQANIAPASGVNSSSFDEYLERFCNLYPHLYDVWASVNLGKNVDEYKYRPELSCAVDQRPDARLFSGFVAPYLKGRVLDIGCGPTETPVYLRNYPIEYISGIDPIEPFQPHPFEFVQGFAEFLPWEDKTFDVVIAATSLDHTLDLNLALSEVKRVLKPGGTLLVWEWFGDHTEPYNPAEKSPELIDRYHLFNFDEHWFEEVVGKGYMIVEKVRLFGENYHYHFYALKLEQE